MAQVMHEDTLATGGSKRSPTIQRAPEGYNKIAPAHFNAPALFYYLPSSSAANTLDFFLILQTNHIAPQLSHRPLTHSKPPTLYSALGAVAPSPIFRHTSPLLQLMPRNLRRLITLYTLLPPKRARFELAVVILVFSLQYFFERSKLLAPLASKYFK